ncbi:MAG TPA: DMT family transporter, partial [Clostridiaceae bacterium]|nr:DMT family transporter [Clostridiaceae bacterium]
ALAYISGVKGSVLVSSSTFITVLLAPFVVKEDKFNRGKLFALILGFAGIIVANIDKGFDLNFTLRGEGFMLISGAFTALVETLIKPKGKGIAAPVITWGQLLFGSIPLIVIGYIGLEHKLNWNAAAVMLLIYSAIISAVAFILWYELLKVNDAGELAIYRLFIPIFGSILSAIFIPGELFTAYLVLGLILVVLGIMVLNTVGRKKYTTDN